MIHNRPPISVSKSVTQQVRRAVTCTGTGRAVSHAHQDVAQSMHQDPRSVLKPWEIILNHALRKLLCLEKH